MNLVKRAILSVWGHKYTRIERHCAYISLTLVYVTYPFSIKFIAYICNLNLKKNLENISDGIPFFILICAYIFVANMISYYSLLGIYNFFKRIIIENKQKI